MFGAEMLSDDSSVLRFVNGVPRQRNRKRPQSFRRELSSKCRNQARIDAPTQHDSERHVRDQTQPNRILQQSLASVLQFWLGVTSRFGRRRQRPVAPYFQMVMIDVVLQRMTLRQFLDAR